MGIQFIAAIFVEFIAFSSGYLAVAINNLGQPVVTAEEEWHLVDQIDHHLNLMMLWLFTADGDGGVAQPCWNRVALAITQLMREKAKITRNLDGIRAMNKLPGAMVVIDANIETNALREATALNIPTIGLIDTDGDPGLVDIPIPGNDDSLRSIEVVIADLMSAVSDGLELRRATEAAAAKKADDEAKAAANQEETKRSSRTAFKADEPAPAIEQEQAATAVAEQTEDKDASTDAK